MTGVDMARPFRGAYGTRSQAFDIVQAMTGRRSLHAMATRIFYDFGLKVCAPATANRGDAVLLKRDSLGMLDLNGRDILVCSEFGVWRAPLGMAVKAWHV